MKLRVLGLALSLVSGLLPRAAAAADELPARIVSLLSGRDLAGWCLDLGDVKPAAGAVRLQLEKLRFEVRRILLSPL
jgi:hypothetical protein